MCLSPAPLLSCVNDYLFLCVVSVCSCFTMFLSNVIVITCGCLSVFYVLCHFSIVYSLQLCPVSLFSCVHVHFIVLSVFMFNIFAFCVVAVLCWSCCFLFLMALLLP